LRELKAKPNEPKARKKNKKKLKEQIKNIIHGKECQMLIKVSIEEKKEAGRFDIDWEIDSKAYEWLTENHYGKRLLVTCRDKWSDKEIIAACFGQSNVEHTF